MQKHKKNTDAQDPCDTRRQEETDLMFKRVEHFLFSILLDFTGAPLTASESIACPYWAPLHPPPFAPLAHSTFDPLLSSLHFLTPFPFHFVCHRFS